jgi:hypothetical protein
MGSFAIEAERQDIHFKYSTSLVQAKHHPGSSRSECLAEERRGMEQFIFQRTSRFPVVATTRVHQWLFKS